MPHGLIYWTVTFSLLCISEGLKPEQIVRRGPGSDPQCMSPLISSHEEFPDGWFSSSSVLQNKTGFQPYQARLIEVYGSREHTSGFAWCPDSLIGEMLREWIQADFNELVIIKSIFTAGRGDGNVREFMPSFVLRYQREDDGAWYEHVKRDGTRVLKANSDPRNLARATLDSIIIAKRIRIYPYSRKGTQKVCLRFALYGCKFPDGVVSYSMPQGGWSSRDSLYQPAIGDVLDASIVPQLKDLSYDGQVISTTDMLSDGLGQLMDNVAFLGNLTRESDLYPSQPGFHFVGWHPKDQGDVQILFKFDRPRQFTWLRLFTFDSIALRVRLFARATVTFSLDGVQFGNAVEFSTGRAQFFDSRTASLTRSQDHARFGRSERAQQHGVVPVDLRMYTHVDYDGAVVVELPLGERIGRYIRLSLTPTDNWLVLTEVQFNSTVARNMPISAAVLPLIDDKSANRILSPAADSPSERNSQLADSDSAQAGTSKTVATGPRNTNANGRNTMDVDERSGGLGNFQSAPIKAESNGPRSIESDSENDKLVAILPVIVTTSVLLLLLPIILLIWFCSRKHFKRTRCGHKMPLGVGARGDPHHPEPVDGFAHGQSAITADELAKLLGSYSTVPFKAQNAGAAIPTSQFCLPNGTHTSNLAQRLNEAELPSSAIGILSNFQQAQYLQARNATSTVQPPGATLACSPNSSGSNSEAAPTLPGLSTLASANQQGNFASAPETSCMYAGADTTCMSPEYASASIFGYSPPPSEAPSNPPPTCMETMPPTNYRPGLPNYGVTMTQSVNGLTTTALYTGPASNPLGGTTFRVPSKHATPNPAHRHPSGGGLPTTGLLFLPQSQFVNPQIDDQNGLYPTIPSKNYGIFHDQGQTFGLYQTNLLAAAAGSHPQAVGSLTMANPLEPWFLPSSVPLNSDPQKAVWLSDGCNNGLLTNHVIHQFTCGPHLHTASVADPAQTGSNISPQHSVPHQVSFKPAVHSIQQCSHPHPPTVTNSAHCDLTYHRGSPVGAAVGTVPNYLVGTIDPTSRDGASSGRLSIYSVCT